MRHTLTMRQWVPYSLPEVFNFFANPANLPPLMPSWQAARIERTQPVAPPAPPRGRLMSPSAAAGAGTRMLISFRPFPWSPVRMHWDAYIAEFRWDGHFCDEQLTGPFGYWRHCHRVVAEERDGVAGTCVTDHVVYAFPFGVLGDLAWAFGGALQVRSLFRYRQRMLPKLLPASLHAE